MWKRISTSDSKQADVLLQELVRLDDTPYFGKLKTQTLMKAGKFPDALNVLENLDSRFENDAEIKMLFGNVNLSLNNKGQALLYFKKALELAPENDKLRVFIDSME
jgi:predicted Zn-dependent protease